MQLPARFGKYELRQFLGGGMSDNQQLHCNVSVINRLRNTLTGWHRRKYETSVRCASLGQSA